jgi:hypothetical protein
MDQHLQADDVMLVENPPPADIDAIFAIIRTYNDGYIGAWRPERLGLFVRDTQGQILGGIYIFLARGWMHLDGLAVARGGGNNDMPNSADRASLQ